MDTIATIGRDTIEVVYDGRGLAAEAEALGRETGIAQGDEHAKAFDERVSEGQSRTGKKLEEQWQTIGKSEGERRALSFNEAFGNLTKSKLDNIARDMAKVFGDEGGLDAFRAKLGDVGQGFDGVGHSADALQGKLQQLFDNKQIDYNLFRRLSTDVKTWASNAEIAEAAAQRQKGALADLGDEIRGNYIEALGKQDDAEDRRRKSMQALGDEIHGNLIQHYADLDAAIDRDWEKAHRANLEYDSAHGALGRLSADLGRTSSSAVEVETAFGRLESAGRSFIDLSRDGERDLPIFRSEFEKLSTVLTAGEAGFKRQHSQLLNFNGDLKGAEQALENAGGFFSRFFKTVDGGGGPFSRATSRIKGLVSAFGNFDPFDNAGQLILLIIGLLGPLSVLAGAAAGGLLILGTSAGAAVGGLIGFYAILQDIAKMDPGEITKLPKQMRDNALAFRDLIGTYDKTKFSPGKLFTGLQTALTDTFLKTKGLDGVMKGFTDTTLPAIESALKPVATAIGELFKQALTGLGSKNGLTEIKGLLESVAGLLPGLGKLAGDALGIIAQLFKDATPFAKKFEDDLDGSLKKFLEFLQSPEGHDAVTAWLNNAIVVIGKVGDVIGLAVDGISKLAGDPEQMQNTVSALQGLGAAVPGIVLLGEQLGLLAPVLAGLVGAVVGLATMFGGAVGAIIGGLQELHEGVLVIGNGIVTAFNDMATGIGVVAADIAQLLKDALSGNFKAVAGDAKQLTDDVGTAFKKLGSDIAGAFDNMSAIFDGLDATSKATLNSITAQFGLTGGAAKEAGGIIAAAAGAAGVSLNDLADAHSIDDLIGKMGLVGPAADDFRDAIVKAAAKSGTSFQLLNTAAQGQLQAVSTKLGLTGQNAKTFQEKVAEMTGGNQAKLAQLAKDGSLNAVIHTLGLTGGAADKFRALFAGDMSGAGSAANHAKSLVDAFGTSVIKLPNGKTVNIKQAGAEGAATAVGNLIQKIAALHDREVTVTANYIANGSLGNGMATGGARPGVGALGGLVGAAGFLAGGRPFGPGRRFAFGGVLSSPTWLNSGALAGEDGLEAVVPLRKPINQIDPSVRELAMIARGMSPFASASGTGASVTVAPGAIVVQEAGDGRTTAGAVLDRLAAKLGG